jgi:hypothetical protein
MFLIRRTLVATVAGVLVTGCRSSSEPGTVAPGNPSVVVEQFGGMINVQRQTTIVDSASATWVRIVCEPSISSSPCLRGTPVASGNVLADAKRTLFSAVRAPQFLTLPQVIPGGGGPEVDGVRTTLLVTVSGNLHLVQWNSGAEIPTALAAVMDAFRAATK